MHDRSLRKECLGNKKTSVCDLWLRFIQRAFLPGPEGVSRGVQAPINHSFYVGIKVARITGSTEPVLFCESAEKYAFCGPGGPGLGPAFWESLGPLFFPLGSVFYAYLVLVDPL